MEYKNLLDMGKKYVALPLALSGSLMTGCASTGGIDYTKNREVKDVGEVVQQSQLNYATLADAIATSMEEGTYNAKCPKGVITEYNKLDDEAFMNRFMADSAKVALLYCSLNGTGGESSGGGSQGGLEQTIGSGSQSSSGGSAINP